MTDLKAYIIFGSQLAKPSAYPVTVTDYTQGYNVQMNTITVRRQKMNYPIKVKEQDFQFTVQCRNWNEYQALGNQIRASHLNSLNNIAQGIVQFTYPKMGIDYLGFITQVGVGVRRFDIAPVLPLSMLLVTDNINKLTSYAYQNIDWRGIYGTNLVNIYAATTQQVDYTSAAGAANPPTFPYKPLSPSPYQHYFTSGP